MEARIRLISKEEKEEAFNMCLNIKKKDSTFKFWIEPSGFGENDFMLKLFSDNKDQLHKRALWFVSKLSEKVGRKLHYEVR